MDLLSNAHVTHVSYILILYSISFLLFLFVSMLLRLYATITWPVSTVKGQEANGTVQRPNGHINRRIHDAEEFELEGLMSEDEETPDKRTGPIERSRDSEAG